MRSKPDIFVAIFIAIGSVAIGAIVAPAPRVMSLKFDEDADAAVEARIKVALLFNFARFTKWPPSAFEDASSSLVVGITGEDTLGKALEDLLTKKVGGRSVAIRREVPVSEWGKCHILYVSEKDEPKLKKLKHELKGRCVLTVGQRANFAREFGIVNFYRAENRMAFEVNSSRAKSSRLEISSRVLRLAKLVSNQ